MSSTAPEPVGDEGIRAAPRRLRQSLALLLLAVLPAAAGACGSEGGGSSATSTLSIKGSIVFASPRTDAADIYLVHDDQARLIAKDASAAAAQPALSPDGKLVAYVNRRGQIVVVGRDGTNPLALTQTVDPNNPAAALIWNLAWLPDGRISFAVTQQTPNAMGLGVIHADGSGLELLTNRATNAASFSGVYAWSPDGKRAVFSCSFGNLTRPRICLFHTASGTVRTLAKPPVNFSQLDWSHDGRQILAGDSSDSSGQAEGKGLRKVYVLDTSGRVLRAIEQPRPVADAAWSPDGTMIVYSSERSRNGSFGLWIMKASGSDAKRLTRLPGVEPDWSPR